MDADRRVIALARDMVAQAEKRLPYACATLFRNHGVEIRVDRKDEYVAATPSRAGFVLSLFNGEYFHEYATDQLETDRLSGFCRRAIAEVKPVDGRYAIDPGAVLQTEYETPQRISLESCSLAEKLDLMRYRRDRVLKETGIVNAQSGFFESHEEKTFVNRARCVHERIHRVSHILVGFANTPSGLKYEFLSRGGTGGMECIAVKDEEFAMVASRALELGSAQRIEPGFYDVIAAPEISGLIAHEAFGHGVETDMYLKNRARSRDYQQQLVGSPLVNIIDDPSLPGAFGSYYIDDEGEPARPTHIIKDGRYVMGLTDLYSHVVLGLPRTANGRRESFARKIYTRMSNTYFQPGTSSLEAMIASIENGVYLVRGMSGMEDPKGWGIQIIALYGMEIKQGRLTGRLLSPLGITGYVPDLLASVCMVGGDLNLDVGLCGKGHKEWVPVSSGGPHIKARVRLG